MSTFKEFIKCHPTKMGLIFALLVPMLFTIVWMTGYRGANDRIDRIHAAIVNEAGEEGNTVLQQLTNSAPFDLEQAESLNQARKQMFNGKWSMIVFIPETFADGRGEIRFEMKEDVSDVVKSMLSASAYQMTDALSATISQTNAVQATIVGNHSTKDFSANILPMLLGFIPYIAMMTSAIQFNLSSKILTRAIPKWRLFWNRQALLACIAVLLAFMLTTSTRLFISSAASFGATFGFQLLLILACIATTQMAFELFGSAGPLFNVAIVPFQLMTAGNIISSDMLAPFYRNIGSFLPASNGIKGFMHLIYGGQSIATEAIQLSLIFIVAWGITLLKQVLTKKLSSQKGVPLGRAFASQS
ncbi:YhgE/Pip domain-containing protein [Paenibacillus antibioticophila]|uniref:YhgE/Pip domain-containing protein n=1 Tax=Paenibacillus antibioticophila TaxID=1274374 RepID=UPI0005CAC854|nr:ABC transporter permease [Paenibacillus antibioticophila]